MKNYKHVYLLAVALVTVGLGTRKFSAAQTQTGSATNAGASAQGQVAGGGQSSANAGNDAKLDGNTALVAEFSQSLNSKNAKIGETVKARVIQDVIAHGKVLVRRDSKLIGHITEVQASTKDAPESRLGIVFDKVTLKGGGELEFRGLIEAMAAPLPPAMNALDPMGPPPMGGGYSGGGPQPVAGSGQTSGKPGSNPGAMGSASPQRPSVSGNSGIVGVLPNEQPLGPSGALSAGAHGVFNLPGIRLVRGLSGGANASVVLSVRDNVKLESGVQIVIQVDGTP